MDNVFSLLINISFAKNVFIDWNCVSDERCGPWTSFHLRVHVSVHADILRMIALNLFLGYRAWKKKRFIDSVDLFEWDWNDHIQLENVTFLKN